MQLLEPVAIIHMAPWVSAECSRSLSAAVRAGLPGPGAAARLAPTMATAHHDGTARTGARRRPHDRDEAASEPEVPSAASTLLALQRTAGNAAVGSWLRGARTQLVQRDHNVPDAAHSLDDVGAAAKDIQVDIDTVSISGRAWYFKNDQLKARPGIGVETRFAGRMAAGPDNDAEQALRNGLGSLALIMFGLDAERPKQKGEEEIEPRGAKPKARRPSTADLTRFEDLDLTPYGGRDGHYRFTAVTEKGSASKPSEVVLIVELLRARSAPFKSWDQLDAGRRAALDARFKRFGYVKHVPRESSLGEDSDVSMPWLDDQWGRVLQAIEKVPEEILGAVPGIAWQRGHGPKSEKGEAGHYDTKTGLRPADAPERGILIYDDAFKSDETLLGVVAHEVAHGFSNKPSETGGTAVARIATDFGKAAKADGIPITKYGEKDVDEAYADAYATFVTEPETLRTLRPKTYAWFAKQQADLKPPARAR
jgi:hypothetical protein